MGGEIHLMQKEFNVSHDPEAAGFVLKSRIPTFVGTCRATRQLAFPIPKVEELTGNAQSSFHGALYGATKMWWGDLQMKTPGPVSYDIVPVFG